jgi:hypothetical protein
LLMLLAIADFADDHGNAYPSVPTLATKCRMTPRNANHILSALRACGELEVRQNEGPKGCNRYRIRLGGEPLKPASPLKRASPLKPASSTPEAGFPKPLKPASDKPSLNHQEPLGVRKTRAKRPEKEHPLFIRFYGAYPRKVARLKAAEVFAEINPDETTLAAMLKAIDEQQLPRRCAEGEGQFVPHPASWLRQGRWTDEPLAPLVHVGASNGRVAL